VRGVSSVVKCESGSRRAWPSLLLKAWACTEAPLEEAFERWRHQGRNLLVLSV